MTKKVTLEPLEKRQVSCIPKCSVHRKGVSVVAEPLISKLNNFQQIYTVPTYAGLNLAQSKLLLYYATFQVEKLHLMRGK